ncbi:MAG TPA: hypothetical protein VKU19_41825 [Bryobacteraceae bacterium]|nr:hypothetical protein [Bryobacteraceae bacterium]
MRFLFLTLALPFILVSQNPAPNARDIVARAAAAYAKNAQNAHGYNFQLREVEQDLDAAGKPKTTQNRTWEVSMQEGSPYRRLVARNDQPISAEEQKQEADRLQWNIEQRRKETPEQREARIAEWRRREDRRNEPVKDVPDAFDFQIVREETVNGTATWVIEANPKPGYKPKTTATSFFPKVKLHLWIDKREFQCVKAEMEVQAPVSFGGFVIRVAKGAHLVLEQTRVSDELWLPKRFVMDASAKVMLVKGYHRALDMTFSEYKKLQTGTPAIAANAGAAVAGTVRQ